MAPAVPSALRPALPPPDWSGEEVPYLSDHLPVPSSHEAALPQKDILPADSGIRL